MILKKIKKKKKFQFVLFYKIYFFISLAFLSVAILIFLNTGTWINSKKELLNKIYFNGINNYSKIFEISLKGYGFFIK